MIKNKYPCLVGTSVFKSVAESEFTGCFVE
jgi:hypothetical protein